VREWTLSSTLIGIILFPTNLNTNSLKYVHVLFLVWSDEICWRLHACLMGITHVQVYAIIVGIICVIQDVLCVFGR
jgi:hypothetical protein